MDGACHRDELYGMTVEDMEEIVKRQERDSLHFYQTVCVNCPTKNCKKRDNETQEEYYLRQWSSSIICQNQAVLDCMTYNLCEQTNTPYIKQMTWEDCSWNRK